MHTPLSELNGTHQPSRARYPSRHLRDRGGLAAVPNALTFLAAVWLLLAAISLDHTTAGRWNDLVVGTAITLVALTRAISPRSIPWLDWINVALGGWLVTAPLLLGYDTPTASVNDVAVGLVVIALASVSAAISWRARSMPRFDAHPGDSSRMR